MVLLNTNINTKGLLRTVAATLLVTASNISVSLAAGDAHEVEGLPQLNFATYTSQIFWMLIVFAVLYIFFAKKSLPEISGVIENRKNHIQSDLEVAEKLAAEADEVQESYHASLAKAQEKAAKELKKVETDMNNAATEAAEEYRLRSDKELKKAEDNIAKAQEAAMGDMNSIAAQAASDAVVKIIGGKADVKKAQSIVEGLNSKTARKAKAA